MVSLIKVVAIAMRRNPPSFLARATMRCTWVCRGHSKAEMTWRIMAARSVKDESGSDAIHEKLILSKPIAVCREKDFNVRRTFAGET